MIISGELGLHRLADRNLQANRRRSAGLLHRRADEARQPLARRSHRRAHAMGLGGRAFGQGTRGLTLRPENQAISTVGPEE
jgi:hypothetical protein